MERHFTDPLKHALRKRRKGRASDSESAGGLEGCDLPDLGRPDARSLIVYGRPRLVRPSLVMGFEGWADAGKVSSGVIGQLRDRLQVKRFAEIRPDDFHVFQSPGIETRRPVTSVESGLVKSISLPSTRFWLHKGAKSGRDLIVALGLEPELRWNEYADLVLDLAQDFGVETLCTIGGSFDNVPHTAEPIITAVLSDESLRPEMEQHGVGLTEYYGPASIHTMLMVAAKGRGLKAASLWGHVPYYVQIANAKVCHGILSKLTTMLGLPVDLEDLRKAGEYLDEQVTDAVRQRPELQSYVRRLEEEHGKGEWQSSEPPTDDIINEIEDFLRQQKDHG